MHSEMISSICKDVNLREIIDIKEIPMSVDDKNKIYILTTLSEKYLIKLLPKSNSLGEEDLFDVLYDCKVHALVTSKLKNITPRNVIYFGTYKNYNYVIQNYVDGCRVTKSENLLHIIDNIWDEMLYLQSCFASSITSCLINTTYFSSDKVTDFLKPYYENRNYINYTSKALQFYTNDLIHFAPSTYIDAAIKVGNNLVDGYLLKEYVLVHADLKLSNVLLEKDNINIFDWSKSHFGDPLVDFADVSIIKAIYGDFSHVESFLGTVGKLNLHIEDSKLMNMLKFYIYYKTFSIARVFAKDNIDSVCFDIVRETDILSFFKNQIWLKGINF